MSFPRYPRSRDSGISWLGELPEHWNVVQSRRLFAVRNEPAGEADKQVTASQKYGILYQADFVQLEGRRVVETIKGTESLKRVEPNDFVISLRSFQGGIEWCRISGAITFHYVVLTPTKALHEPFFAYLFKSDRYIQALRSTTNLIRDGQDLRFSHFTQVDLPIVPIDEQREIAAFLNRETQKIDALVAEQQRLIELLKEKRQAVISHAVIKGLNQHAPMKHSGIEWLGDVPAHWDVCRFHHAIDFQEGPGIMASDFHETGIPLVRVAGVQGRWVTLDGCNFLQPELVAKRWEHFRLQNGDLLISASASLGTVAEVGENAVGAVPYTGLIRLIPKPDRAHRDFIRLFVVSDAFIKQIDQLKAGATIQHYGPTHLRQIRLALPSLEEQHAIASSIDERVNHLDLLIAEADRAIALLDERRISLISAAVTGKIDVRGLAATEAA